MTKHKETRMKRINIVLFFAVATATALAAPPGYSFGARNCGFPAQTGAAGCQVCCRQGLLSQQITQAEYNGCMAFCNQYPWPRRPWLTIVDTWAAHIIYTILR